MTAVIASHLTTGYLHEMAAKDDIQWVAAALERPTIGYVKRLAQTQRTMAARSGEASRQLGVFIDRIADLTIEELRELHDETFRADEATIRPLVERLVRRQTSCLEASAALTTFAGLLARFESERNPHAYVVRALCVVLLGRARSAEVHEGLGS